MTSGPSNRNALTSEKLKSPFEVANVRLFIAFRILFNARFYYPVFTIIFLDFGLTIEQFAILNVWWAVSIVLLEVPSGALADTIGRRNLVVAASAIMVVEISLLCFAPLDSPNIVFYLFLVNRLLSGAAEAAASGADEALAYDSLKERGGERLWPKVLENQMKFQSLAFVLAMSLGAFLYDHERLTVLLAFFGSDLEVPKSIAMRLPLILTLFLSLGALTTSLRMKELHPEKRPSIDDRASSVEDTVLGAFRSTLSAGAWILKTPLAFMIIAAGMLFDHIARMVLTLNSQYYRQIELPEASFGLISSGLAVLGFFIPKLGRYLADNRSRTFNFFLIGGLMGVGLLCMAQFWRHWGALPMGLIYTGIFLTGFFVSHYLNEIASSETRATILSFKGLSFNLAYGAIGIIYARYIGFLKSNAAETENLQEVTFAQAQGQSPLYFGALFVVVIAIGAILLRQRSAKP